jgi:hypothetical protein
VSNSVSKLTANDIIILAILAVCSAVFLLVSIFLLVFYMLPFLKTNEKHLSYCTDYLRSINYKYQPENAGFQSQDLTAMFMTCVATIFAIVQIVKFICNSIEKWA